MFELDHVVYFTTKNPQQVVEQEQIEGLHPVKGGQHLDWGTYNALFYTKNSYIEWLAIEDENIAKQSTQPLVKQLLYDIADGEGFASLCLRSNDIEKKNRYFQKMGYRTSGIIPAERRTSNGELRKWKMLFIDHKIDHTLPYPFFIQWEQTDEERYSSLREDGTVKPENEELTIKRCTFHVKNVEEKLIHWSRLLSLPTKGNTLKLGNTVFVFEEKHNSKERLHTIEIAKG